MLTSTDYSEAGYRLQAGPLHFSFHPAGDLYEAVGENLMLNQLLTHPYDGSLNQIYLRLRRDTGFETYPLLGVRSAGRIDRLGNQLRWQGQAAEVGYEVVFSLSDRGVWFWDVALETGAQAPQVDLFYGQDLGLALPGAVRSNEAYNAQYIDHSAYHDERQGWIVCSRQNQPQDGRFPYLQQGCLDGAVAYATDGFQFFGLGYKETGEPEALSRDTLPSQVYQYEFAYTTLQAQPVFTAGRARAVFYGLFRADHAEAVTGPADDAELEAAWRQVKAQPQPHGSGLAMPQRAADLGVPVSARSLTAAEIDALYPQRIEEEWQDGCLLSFFLPDGEHIVLKEKELRSERPHGHILLSGLPDQVGEAPLASTAYMYGVFHSQLVLGNTSFNKLLSHTRSALNTAHVSGLRLYAELDGQFRMLAMPSLFEMGFNYARWIYALQDDSLVITSYTGADAPLAGLRVESRSGMARRYLATAQITMQEREFEGGYLLEPCHGGWRIAAEPDAPAGAYPDLSFRLSGQDVVLRASDDRRLMPGDVPSPAPLLVLETDAVADWGLTIEGGLDGCDLSTPLPQPDWQREKAKFLGKLEQLMNGFRLEHPGGDPAVRRLDLLARWYTHNMLVHFASPHGLEQYGGAAWGTRDVCQGPAEYFLAMQRTDTVRDILATVYSHQYEESGTWPQWFMFDRYSAIQQHESHGDIIVWPLKLLGDYLETTGDDSILELELPYTDEASFAFTEQHFPLRTHVELQLDYIRRHYRPGTSLSSYGDGDWDDTLQPARPELRAHMVSSWTVALTYQSTERLGRLLASSTTPETAALGAELTVMATAIRADFHHYMEPDQIIPGFLYMEDEAQTAVKWLHPSDDRTGIHYRLLPMTRSMIAGLITPEQATAHYELIHRELNFPDGVRLMNRPAAYEGGVSHRFKRAEQAANFGREVGLQYVHAHIRFIEAMAKLGKPQDAWRGLQAINPIGLADVVPGAQLRQSNAYFSSSDGAFATRAEAAARFGELKTGEAAVKGGWRIYSSGPGIYMHQLVCNVLGVRVSDRCLELDPVLPQQLDGLTFRFAVAGMPVLLCYRLSGDNQPITRVIAGARELELQRLTGPYRATGAALDLDALRALAPAAGEALVLTIEA